MAESLPYFEIIIGNSNGLNRYLTFAELEDYLSVNVISNVNTDQYKVTNTTYQPVSCVAPETEQYKILVDTNGLESISTLKVNQLNKPFIY
jgi:hypothetical protein